MKKDEPTQQVANKYRITKNAALKYLAVTSIIVTYPLGLRLTSEIFGAYAHIAAAAISFLIYFVIDVPLSDALEYLEKTSGQGGKNVFKLGSLSAAQKIRAGSVFIAFIGLLTTGGMSFIANTLISDAAAPTPKSKDLEKGLSRSDSVALVSAESITAEIERADKEVWRAKESGHNLVQNAIKSGSRWQRTSFEKDGFSWLEARANKDRKDKKYAAEIRKAMADSSKAVEDARQFLSVMRGQKLSMLSGQDTIKTGLINVFQKEQSRADLVFSSVWKFLLVIDIVAVIIALFSSWCLGNFFAAGGQLPAPARSFSFALSEFMADKMEDMTNFLFPVRHKAADKTGGQKPAKAPDKMVPIADTSLADRMEQERLASELVRLRQEIQDQELQRQKELEAAKAERVKAIQEEQRQKAEAEERARQEAEEKERRNAEERRRIQIEQKRQIEKMRREFERQKAEAEERARQEAIKADKNKQTKAADKTPKPLSDKNPGKLSAKLSNDKNGNPVFELDGQKFADTTKFRDAATNWYNRQFTSAKDSTKAKNAAKWKAAKPLLEKFYILEYSGNRVNCKPISELTPHI